jgi:hypothetical protein
MNAKSISIVTVATGLLVPVSALVQPVPRSLSSTDDGGSVIRRLTIFKSTLVLSAYTVLTCGVRCEIVVLEENFYGTKCSRSSEG